MPISNFKDQKVEELFTHLAAEFLNLEGNGKSLVTVTMTKVTDKLSKATVFFTVFPEDKEAEALDFAKRKRSEFREFVMKKAKMRRLPRFDFEIDIGEKNRQLIDKISAQENI